MTELGFIRKPTSLYTSNIKTVIRTLELIKEEAARQPHHIAREILKVGATIAVAQAGLL